VTRRRRTVLAAVAASAALLLSFTACNGATPAQPAKRAGAPDDAPASGGGDQGYNGGGSAEKGGGPAPMAPPAQDGAAAPGGAGSRLDGDVGPEGSAPLTDPQADMVSTFALDVDTASYDYAKRTITDGRLPDPAQVRPEEFVNAFDQDYPQPAGDGIAVQADGAALPPWPNAGGGRYAGPASVDAAARLLRVGLQTRSEAFGQRADANLTFVVDVSGSMREPGRLDLVQDALHTLIDELRDTDAVAIVAYSTTARVIRPMTPVYEKADLHQAVDELSFEDSTNLEAGLVKGYEVARTGFREGVANRVILLSDGLANTGATTPEAILSKVRENAGKDIALLCVGVGREYGDALMERLADDGDGFAVYVQQVEQARRLFVDRLPGTLSVRARDAKVQVRFNPATVAGHRLIGYENRAVADEDFRNNAADGGELGPGHSVTALYVVHLRPDAFGPVATATARWQAPQSGVADEASAMVEVADLQTPYVASSPRLRQDYVAATFAEHLRGAGWGRPVVEDSLVRDESLEWLAAEADAVAAATEDRAVGELADLIVRAGMLTAR
jgi:Ca-activated chloride channel homolog